VILILGASGRIGGYLLNRFRQDKLDALGTYCQNKKDGMMFFDLKNMTLDELGLKIHPSHIVIAAAANPRPELSKNLNDSYKANVLQTINLIDSCFKKKIIPIYISSDNVFDGEKGNYRETDKTNPLNNYGKMKCEVENYLFASCKPYILLRMGKVFGIDNTLIVETYNNLKQGKETSYADDQIFTPSYAEDLYEFIKDIVENDYQGIFHLGSMKAVTRYEVAQRIKEIFKMENVKITFCKINEFGLSERRPIKIDLNIEKYKKLTGKGERELEYFLKKLIVEKKSSEKWRFDSNGNSVAYFSKTKQVSVSKEMIDELKRISKEMGNVNIRFCLHSNPDENLQDMIVLAYKDKTCRRLHQHRAGKEAIHIIEGRAIALIFDKQGYLIDKRILESDGEFAYRNHNGTYHIYFPLTNYIILREIRDGRNGLGETVPPDWDWMEVIKQYLSPEDLGCHNDCCKTPCSLKV